MEGRKQKKQHRFLRKALRARGRGFSLYGSGEGYPCPRWLVDRLIACSGYAVPAVGLRRVAHFNPGRVGDAYVVRGAFMWGRWAPAYNSLRGLSVRSIFPYSRIAEATRSPNRLYKLYEGNVHTPLYRIVGVSGALPLCLLSWTAYVVLRNRSHDTQRMPTCGGRQ